jgi:hypothetical protein
VVLRQHHRPGEKTFVDFCDRIALTDPVSGEKIPTQLIVGALGASSYTFATATLSQELPAWLDCHVRMYEFYQGVSALTIPDYVPGNIIRVMWPPPLCSGSVWFSRLSAVFACLIGNITCSLWHADLPHSSGDCHVRELLCPPHHG